MTLQQIKKYIKGADLVYQDKLTSPEINDYKNIAYYLVKNYFFTKSIRDITTNKIDELLSHLIINSELITIDELKDYDVEDLGRYHYNQILKNNDKMLLMNYYDINNNYKPCKLMFTKNYNIL